MAKRQHIVLWGAMILFLALLLPTNAAPTLLGTRAWDTLLCQFSDVPAQPFDIQAVQTQFGPAYPSISDYWRIQSNNAFTLSTQTLGWYTLPHTQAEYENMGADAGRAALLTDCLQAATRTDTPDTVTAVITNAETTLNGQSLNDVVINPSMLTRLDRLVRISGGALGIPHSTGATANTANTWDALSTPPPTCGTLCIIPHITAYAKMQIGWLTAYATHPNATTESIYSIRFLDAPADDGDHLLLIQSGAHIYTLEARRTSEAYANPSSQQSALVIHRVDSTAPVPIQLHATLESADASLTLTDAGLTVTVEYITATGFQVRVKPITTQSPTPKPSPDTTPGQTATPVTPTSTPFTSTPTPSTSTPSTPTPINYVYNGSFELKNAAFLPQNWARTKLTQDIVVCNTTEKIFAHTGECAFRFRGSTGESSQLSQKILLPAAAAQRGTILEVSAYTRSQKLVRGVLIQVQVYYVDPALSPENLITRSGKGFGQYRYNAASIELAGQVAYAILKLTYNEPKGALFVDDVTVTLR